ncbi:MAG: acyl-CoA dehydrogenase family protein [Burkholderiaceae bacterium]
MNLSDIERFGFSLSADNKDIRDVMTRFAREQLAPGSALRDKSGLFPTEQINALAQLGAMAMKTPADAGGPGVDNQGYALCIEALSRFDPSVAVVTVASNLAAAILSLNGTPAQQEKFLRPLVQGGIGHAAFALTESHAGSDAAAIRTQAIRSGGNWTINGSKQWITGASDSRLFVVFARTPGDSSDKATTCFVVPNDTPGFSIGRIEDKMGLRSSGTAELQFTECRIPDGNRIGDVGAGLQIALGAISPSRVAIAAQSIGIAERAFELGLAYAAQRQAFGQALTGFQNTRFVLADCRAALDQAWLLMLRAASLLDNNIEIRGEASMAKLVASEVCTTVVDKMLQLHGGNGYSSEYEIERLYRDARVMRIFEGTSEIQREVIARDILAQHHS